MAVDKKYCQAFGVWCRWGFCVCGHFLGVSIINFLPKKIGELRIVIQCHIILPSTSLKQMREN